MNPKKLTAKEFLAQAQHIDQRINSKLEQARSLRELAAKATAALSDAPRQAAPNIRRMEDAIVKMAYLEAEINEDINELISIKRDVRFVINQVSCPEYQLLLELRYIGLKTWDEVAAALGYVCRQTTRMHGAALEEVNAILQREKKAVLKCP